MGDNLTPQSKTVLDENVLRFDRYGFAVFKQGTPYFEDDHRCHNYSDDSCSKKLDKALRNQLDQWGSGQLLSPFQLRKFIKCGVPSDLRGKMWKTLLGAKALQANSLFDYQNTLSDVRSLLVDAGVSEYGGSKCITNLGIEIGLLGCDKENMSCVPSSPKQETTSNELHAKMTHMRQIMLDVERSFPTHKMFIDGSTEGKEGRASLFRVLAVYAHYNTQVSYCQGMSYIAGMLLMNMDEEDAFWCLVSLFERPKYLAGYFDNSLSKIQIHAAVFERLMKQRIPGLYKHLNDQGVAPLMYLTPWFMALYTSLSCWDTVLCIWDLIILDGVSVIFRVAFAILRGLSDDLLSTTEITHSLPMLLHPPENIMSKAFLVPLIYCVRVDGWEIDAVQAVLHEESDKREIRKAKRQLEKVAEDEPRRKRQKTNGDDNVATSLVNRMVEYIATPIRQAIFGHAPPAPIQSNAFEMVTFTATSQQSPPVGVLEGMRGCCSSRKSPASKRSVANGPYSPRQRAGGQRFTPERRARISSGLMSPVRRSQRLAAQRMPLKAGNTSTSSLISSSAKNQHAFRVFNTPTPLRRTKVDFPSITGSQYGLSSPLNPFSSEVTTSPDVEMIEFTPTGNRLDFTIT
ncbi:small G protein signaling modulator 3 homolog isoform X2 [Nematostella vectensis]|uniref:small G protein signaling modulator 3 homolog isoform X2 n=1 Tax=Nematostella vectensis TaxID=45351 RepID=UPI00207762E6|nr:small G protein signaling modulator 3 homolog isoform X2 [Nematostella vectensis]